MNRNISHNQLVHKSHSGTFYLGFPEIDTNFPCLQEVDEMKYESYARIEHELTGRWLHALKDEEYVPQEQKSRGSLTSGLSFLTRSGERTLSGLRTDEASLCKVRDRVLGQSV